MAEYSGFFNAKELDTGGYDREYDAEQFADYFSRFISNGVFGNPANNLQVVYLDNSEKPFNVTIKKGSAFIYEYKNSSKRRINRFCNRYCMLCSIWNYSKTEKTYEENY